MDAEVLKLQETARRTYKENKQLTSPAVSFSKTVRPTYVTQCICCQTLNIDTDMREFNMESKNTSWPVYSLMNNFQTGVMDNESHNIDDELAWVDKVTMQKTREC